MKTNFRVLQLAILFHKECQKLKLKAYLKGQLERATSSCALNIQEGNGRLSSKDRKKFFNIAYTSVKEAEIALLLGNIHSKYLFGLSDHIGGCLYKLSHK